MKKIGNCKKCGMLFSTTDNATLCRHCSIDEEEVFKPLREYLYDNPGTSLYELSVKFNLSVSRIQSYIRNGKFGSV